MHEPDAGTCPRCGRAAPMRDLGDGLFWCDDCNIGITDEDDLDEKAEFPCHWTHYHGRHEWLPLVEDPEAPRTFYLDVESGLVTCPGKPKP